MKNPIQALVVLLLLGLSASYVNAKEEGGNSGNAVDAITDAARAIGHTSRAATRTIGHATRDVVKSVGHATRDVTRDIGHASRDTAKKIGNSGRKAASQNGTSAAGGNQTGQKAK